MVLPAPFGPAMIKQIGFRVVLREDPAMQPVCLWLPEYHHGVVKFVGSLADAGRHR